MVKATGKTPWQEGVAAFWAERHIADCPYTSDASWRDREAWIEGYQHAYDEYYQVVLDYGHLIRG